MNKLWRRVMLGGMAFCLMAGCYSQMDEGGGGGYAEDQDWASPVPSPSGGGGGWAEPSAEPSDWDGGGGGGWAEPSPSPVFSPSPLYDMDRPIDMP